MKKELNTKPENLAKPLLTTVFLVPYLPFKLKCQIKNGKQIKIDVIQAIYNNEVKAECTFFNIVEAQQGFEFVKPILRPLSDFYDINAPAFVDTNFDIRTQLVLADLCSKKQHYSGVRYADMQEFLREHIDVFNLIEEDLAISIHDVV